MSSSWSPSERIRRLAAEHGRAVPAVGVERAIHYTDFYKNEAKRYSTAQQLNAHSLAHHLRRRTIRIYDHELIVGTHTEHRIGAICHIEKAQKDFLDASLVALDAIEMFADRYRAEAESQERADLVALLQNSPRKPASTFHEALQTIWFFQLIVQVESLDQGISLGRMDQYLHPLYLKEKARGDFDPAEIRDLLAAFCLKLSEVIPLFSQRATKLFSGWPSGQALTIGGIDADGNDSSNELTFALLDVMDCFKTRQPNWHARISKNSAPAYVRRVVSVIAHGGGSPALYNDDVIMPAMVKRGVSPEKVWNYATVGCVEPALSKESFTSSDAALFNLAINLELVLGGGKQLKKSKQGKRPWLRGIESMDELFDLFERQTAKQLAHLKECLDAIENANAEAFPTPYSSLTIMGCVDGATDLTAGGAPYNASGIQAVGVADVVNSLAVIEQLVFIDRTYLATHPFPVEFRMPLVPGYTDTEENIDAVIEFLKSVGHPRLHLLEYHDMGEVKIDLIQGKQPKLGLGRYTREALGAIARRLEEAGIEIANRGALG